MDLFQFLRNVTSMLNCNDELTCATSYKQWLEQTVPKQQATLQTWNRLTQVRTKCIMLTRFMSKQRNWQKNLSWTHFSSICIEGYSKNYSISWFHITIHHSVSLCACELYPSKRLHIGFSCGYNKDSYPKIQIIGQSDWFSSQGRGP